MVKINKGLRIAKICKFAAIVLLLLSFLIPLLPAITLTSGDVKKTYSSAYSFIFGGSISTTNISYSTKGVSGLCLAGFILLVLATITLVLPIFFKELKFPKSVFTLASALMMIVTAILFACAHRSISNLLADALISGHSDSVSNTIYNNTSMNFGIWGVSLLNFISSFTLLVSLVFDGSFDKLRAKIGII